MAIRTATKMVVGAGALVAAAWAVRGRSSGVFGPNIWHGSRDRKEIALTFDDGPSLGTPDVLDVLGEYDVPATFFQCGANVEALPEIARHVVHARHEIGNHSHTHPLLALKSYAFVANEMERAQLAIRSSTGVDPKILRPPYGVRWFGMRQLPFTSIMWDVLGLDWKLSARETAMRVTARTRNGSIICLHDGRELDRRASIRNTVEAVRWIVPALLERGFEFRTIGQLLRPPTYA